jgi:release factor glutamine methyltransferase
VKKFEPKSALYSANHGLAHYEKLLKQIRALSMADNKLSITAFLEISPEQKLSLTKIIESIFPSATIAFTKDLAGKWRVCTIHF